MKHTVYVVTAVHNYLAHTKKLLQCIAKQTYTQMKVVIVDDASTDETGRYLGEQKNVTTIAGTGNLWWTGGLNRALEHVRFVAKKGDFVLTINNDCTFDKKYIEHIVDSSLAHERAIIGSIEVDTKTKKTHTGTMSMDWKTGKWANHKRVTKIEKVAYHTTKGTLFPIEVVEKIGLLDEKHLPHYASDIEYTHRAVMQGFTLLCDPSCRISCDTSRTGMWASPTTIKKEGLWTLAFSRRSTINIVDHFYLIKLCCPRELQLRNYFFLGQKILYLLSLTPLLRPLRRLLKL